MYEHISPDRVRRDPPGHPGHPGQTSGVLGRLLQRFQTQHEEPEGVAPVAGVDAPSSFPVSAPLIHPGQPSESSRTWAAESSWDDSRAAEVQAAIHAWLDQVIAAIPTDCPHRQARLNVLKNERGIVAALMAKRDPMLWGWLRSLECMLERWSKKDSEAGRR